MSSDNQFTASGPATIGFQTNSASIDVGADVTGSQAGVRGHADKGIGVEGTSREDVEGNDQGVGVVGRGPSVGVRGIGGRVPLSLTTGTGVDGFSDSGVGVQGHSQQGDGVVGLCDANSKSGVFGFNSKTDGVAF